MNRASSTANKKRAPLSWKDFTQELENQLPAKRSYCLSDTHFFLARFFAFCCTQIHEINTSKQENKYSDDAEHVYVLDGAPGIYAVFIFGNTGATCPWELKTGRVFFFASWALTFFSLGVFDLLQKPYQSLRYHLFQQIRK